MIINKGDIVTGKQVSFVKNLIDADNSKRLKIAKMKKNSMDSMAWIEQKRRMTEEKTSFASKNRKLRISRKEYQDELIDLKKKYSLLSLEKDSLYGQVVDAKSRIYLLKKENDRLERKIEFMIKEYMNKKSHK